MNLFKSNISSATQHLALVLLASFALVSCGGGGGGGSSTSGGNVISGTAATGAPIASGTVTIKDSAGATATTTTDANGNYSFDVNAMRFPLMLKVQPNTPGAAPLFSAGLSNGTANTTPLTTLEVFEATGRSNPADIYNSGDFSKIGKSTLDYGKITVTSNFATRFAANGLDLTTHDPITTPMVANGVGMDAILDQTNVAIIGNEALLRDQSGNCLAYGPTNVVTFSIDGMTPSSLLAFLGSPPLNFGAGMSDEYVKKALAEICVAGIDQPRPLAPNFNNPNVMLSNIIWTRNPSLFDTYDSPTSAVKQLKIQLEGAYLANKLAVSRGGVEGPINIVAHSWGGVIAYIALTELAREGSPIKIANLITLGTPIYQLALPRTAASTVLTLTSVQTSVPAIFQEQPIQVPSVVNKWTNFWNEGDILSGAIGAQNVDNIKLLDTCSALTLSSTLFDCHFVYYKPTGSPGSVLTQIRKIIESSFAATNPVVVTPPQQIPGASVLPPSAFTLSAGNPYCDLSNPPGPAVNLTWTASDGNVNYRVFRNGSAIGVNLVASQFSFQNNLGLVAGQTYSYTVQAMNVNGATWSNAVPVTIPANVCATAPPPCTAPQVLTNGVCVTPTTNTFNISGSTGLQGVTMTLSGASSGGSTTDANGNYTFGNLANGSYTVAPALSGYSFTPSSLVITVNGANITAANFTATSQSGTLYSITGTVTASGSALSGVTMNLSGANSGAYTTGSNGMYGFALLANGSYTVTPTLSGYTFTPASSPITISGANIMGANFTGSAPNIPTAPTLSSISPNPLTQGTSYQNVTFTGSGFTSSSWPQYSVSGGGTWAWATSAPTYNNPNSMTVAVNNTVAQTIYWRVCASNGSTSCSGSQTVTVQPAAVSIPATPTGTATSGVIGTSSGPGPVTPSSTVNMSWNTSSGTGVDYNLIVTDVTSNTQALNIRLPGNTYTTALTAGHQYRWQVAACNTTGCSPYTAAQYFQTPGAVVVLSVNGVASSYIGTGQKTIPLSGSGFNSITQISWSCANPNGSTCTGSPYVWTPGTAKWSNVTITSDTVATVYPTFLIASDPPGTYSWSVTFSGGGQSVTKYFTAIK